jgi:hypothetical protein
MMARILRASQMSFSIISGGTWITLARGGDIRVRRLRGTQADRIFDLLMSEEWRGA